MNVNTSGYFARYKTGFSNEDRNLSVASYTA